MSQSGKNLPAPQQLASRSAEALAPFATWTTLGVVASLIILGAAVYAGFKRWRDSKRKCALDFKLGWFGF